MKTLKYILSAAALAAIALRTAADQPGTAGRPEKTCSGIIVAVDPQGRTLDTKAFLHTRKFMLGSSCSYVQSDNSPGTAAALHPGQKVAISYQDADGVLVADHVAAQPLRYEGTVKSISPDARLLTVHTRMFNQHLTLANNCNVVLRNGQIGSLADIQPGNHVTVTYETPGDKPVARQIAQTSIRYIGTVTAIDLEDRTLKTKSLSGTKRFNVGGSCVIVMHGQLDGQLADLKPNDRLVLHYDEINGVNVVNRIAPATVETNSDTMVFSNPGAGF